MPYYVSGELTGDQAELTMTLRVFYREEDRPSDVIRVDGNVEGLHDIIHDAALLALEHINPYVVALYWRRIELAEGNYVFPRTRVAIDRYLENQPVGEHFLAYGLLGRMFMHKAERRRGSRPRSSRPPMTRPSATWRRRCCSSRIS